MNNPKPDNLDRVLRGGAWSRTTVTLVRAAYRPVSAPSIRGINVGFRCALRSRAPVEVKP